MKKRPEENAMKRMSILIVAAVFAWFGLYGAPNGFGVVPAPDGGYPNFNTAEGQNALLEPRHQHRLCEHGGWFFVAREHHGT